MTHANSTTLAHPTRPLTTTQREASYFLTIVFHPDTTRIGERVNISSILKLDELEINRNLPLFSPPNDASKHSALNDPYLSRSPIRIRYQSNNQQLVIQSEEKHGLLVNGKNALEIQVDDESISEGLTIEICGRIVLLLHKDYESKAAEDTLGMLGHSASIEKLRNTIRKIADTDVPVLIRGESGTGKELVAKAIHNLSARRQNNLVSVNMAAMPESLASAALFGSKKGAFTGAQTEQKGYFRQADNGTLFLDEIGDATVAIQTMLLRALESNEIQPIGAAQAELINTRVISATDTNLEDKIIEGAFRTPLFHRLANYEIYLAPLRQRKDDIGLLAFHFFKIFSDELQTKFEVNNENCHVWRGIFSRFCRYHWPGNIRQLKHVSKQIVLHNRNESILELPEHLEKILPEHTLDDFSDENHNQNKYRNKPKDISNEELERALQNNFWDLKATADDLKLSRSSLYSLLDRHPTLKRAKDISTEDIIRSYRDCDGDIHQMSQILMVSVHALRRRISELPIPVQDIESHISDPIKQE